MYSIKLKIERQKMLLEAQDAEDNNIDKKRK
jgi:hypothetical protein